MSAAVTWVVVAAPRRATIYGIPRGMARLRELEVLDAAAPGNGEDPEAGFAAEIGRHLEQARRDGRFDAWVLVASPAFLVPLRAALSRPLHAALVGEIDRDRMGGDRDRLQAEVLRIL